LRICLFHTKVTSKKLQIKSPRMATTMQQETLVPEKVSRSDDDEMSTISGASSDSVSLPSSPLKAWPATPSSPAEAWPASPVDTVGIPSATLADLPSLGSLGHFVGQCSRCCFHPKGRCLSGHDCRFCHFEHDKRRRKQRPMQVHQQQGYHQQQTYQYAPMPPAPVPQRAPSLAPQIIAPPPPPPPAPTTAPSGSVFSIQGMPQSVECWSVEQVVEWLSVSGLANLSHSFEEHRITGDILCELTSGDLEEIGINALGDKKRFLRAASQLKGVPLLHDKSMQALQSAVPPPPPTPYPQTCNEAPPPPPVPYQQSFNDWGQCSSYPGQQQLFDGAAPNFLPW